MISSRLGHSSIKLTMDTYGHLFDGQDAGASKKLDGLFPAKKEGANGEREVEMKRRKNA